MENQNNQIPQINPEIIKPQKKLSWLEGNPIKSIIVLFLVALIFYWIYNFVIQGTDLDSNVDSIKRLENPTPAPTLITNSDTTETANWKTYTNTKYGYSVEYPANWDIEEAIAITGVPNKPTWSGSILQKNELQKVSFLEKDEQAIWQGTIELNVLQNPKNLNLEEWAKQYFRPLGADPSVNLAKIVGDTTLGGKPAIKFDVFSFDHNEVVIATLHNNLVYQITFDGEIPNDPDKEIHQKIYGQILSTFKFLDKAQMESLDIEHCDIDENGKCDAADLALFQKALGAKRGDLNYHPLADADADGVVTITDKQMLFPATTISPTNKQNQVVCTQDAKLCPDGSYVSRTGPNCEFAPCP